MARPEGGGQHRGGTPELQRQASGGRNGGMREEDGVSAGRRGDNQTRDPGSEGGGELPTETMGEGEAAPGTSHHHHHPTMHVYGRRLQPYDIVARGTNGFQNISLPDDRWQKQVKPTVR